MSTNIPNVLEIYPFVKYKEYTLYPWPCFKDDPGKHLQLIKEFNSRQDDILLCTATKAGTHWIHEIISMLVDNTSVYNSRDVSFGMCLDAVTDYVELEAETRRRILQTHLPFSFVPSKHIEKKAKIVYVNRNPKDRHVSQYLFFRGLRGFPNHWSWNDYFQECVINDTLMTGWFNYTREMTNAAQNKSNNILQVLYEDLILDPIGQITTLAEFLEVPYTTELIENIADKCAFKNLKNHKNDGSVVLHPEGKSTLFRKGIIGDWKNWFTVTQDEIFDVMYQRELKDVDITFTFEM